MVATLSRIRRLIRFHILFHTRQPFILGGIQVGMGVGMASGMVLGTEDTQVTGIMDMGAVATKEVTVRPRQRRSNPVSQRREASGRLSFSFWRITGQTPVLNISKQGTRIDGAHIRYYHRGIS